MEMYLPYLQVIPTRVNPSTGGTLWILFSPIFLWGNVRQKRLTRAALSAAEPTVETRDYSTVGVTYVRQSFFSAPHRFERTVLTFNVLSMLYVRYRQCTCGTFFGSGWFCSPKTLSCRVDVSQLSTNHTYTSTTQVIAVLPEAPEEFSTAVTVAVAVSDNQLLDLNT